MCGQSVHERLVKLGAIRKWRVTETQKIRIKEVYQSGIVRGDGKIRELCEEFGKPRSFISRVAKILGLSDANRTVSEAINSETSARMKALWKNQPHPRGMAGKRHSQEARDGFSKISKARANAMTKLERQDISEKGRKTKISRYGSAANYVKRGSWKAEWIELDGKRFFARSRWEANYARYLNFLKDRKQISEWEHEPETFWFEKIKRGTRSYLPDFRVTDWTGGIEYHEVKGWMDARSKTTINRMRIYHPEIVLKVIDGAWFKSNARQLSGLIPGWEIGKKGHV